MEHWTHQPVAAGIVTGDSIAQATMGKLDAGKLAELLITELRHHGHFNNVLTHLSGADWPLVQKALARLLDWRNGTQLSPFEADLVALLCGERGVTGKLMRPWISHQLQLHLGEQDRARLQRTWHGFHTLRMLLPPRLRTSAMRVIRGNR